MVSCKISIWFIRLLLVSFRVFCQHPLLGFAVLCCVSPHREVPLLCLKWTTTLTRPSCKQRTRKQLRFVHRALLQLTYSVKICQKKRYSNPMIFRWYDAECFWGGLFRSHKTYALGALFLSKRNWEMKLNYSKSGTTRTDLSGIDPLHLHYMPLGDKSGAGSAASFF